MLEFTPESLRQLGDTDTLIYLQSLVAATEIEVAWEMHKAHMARFGFDRVLYGFTRFGTRATLGDYEDALMLTNHPRDYVSAYVHENLYNEGLMVRWASANAGAQSWRWMEDRVASGDVTPRERHVHELNKKFGLIAGYTVSFSHRNMRAKGAIGLTARADLDQDAVDQIWADCGDMIELANNVFHLKVTSLPYLRQARALTDRQREVLELIADGKTVQDVAQVLEIRPTTVEKHLRGARDVMQAETTAHAVARAATMGQIFAFPFPVPE